MVVSRSHQKSLMPAGTDARHNDGHSHNVRGLGRGLVRPLAKAQVSTEAEGEDERQAGISGRKLERDLAEVGPPLQRG